MEVLSCLGPGAHHHLWHRLSAAITTRKQTDNKFGLDQNSIYTLYSLISRCQRDLESWFQSDFSWNKHFEVLWAAQQTMQLCLDHKCSVISFWHTHFSIDRQITLMDNTISLLVYTCCRYFKVVPDWFTGWWTSTRDCDLYNLTIMYSYIVTRWKVNFNLMTHGHTNTVTFGAASSQLEISLICLHENCNICQPPTDEITCILSIHPL